MLKVFVVSILFEYSDKRFTKAKSGSKSKSFGIYHILKQVNDESLQQKMEDRKHIFIDLEMENPRQRVSKIHDGFFELALVFL